MKYLIPFLFLFQSCASYKFSRQTKLVALSSNIQRGRSIGPVEGKDCRWIILGFRTKAGPTLDNAILNAIKNAQVENLDSPTGRTNMVIRYFNNLKTENEGYNLGIIQKQCLHISGVAYL